MVGEILLYIHAGLLGAAFYLAFDGMRYADTTAEYKLDDNIIERQIESKKISGIELSNNEIIEKYNSTLNKLEKVIPTGSLSWHAKRSGIKFVNRKLLGIKM